MTPLAHRFILVAGLAGTAPAWALGSLPPLPAPAPTPLPAPALLAQAATAAPLAPSTPAAAPANAASTAPALKSSPESDVQEEPVSAQTPAAGEASSLPPVRRAAQPSTPYYDNLPPPADSAQADAQRVHFLIGVAANSSPNFFGGKSQDFKLKPVGALEWGRWRLSTGGGYGLMSHGRRDRGSGAEAVLAETDRFNFSLSLNIDRGRDVAETERLQGVPDVRATLRLRARARYNLTDRWTVSLAAAQDILGRGRGMEVDSWLGYRWPVSEKTRVGFGMGASWGNRKYMSTQFGIPQTSTLATGYPAFAPRAGLYLSEVGVDVAHALSRSWVIFGGLRYARLHGDARRSPLTVRHSGVSATIGLAWRN